MTPKLLTVALTLPLVACGDSSATNDDGAGSTSMTAEGSSDGAVAEEGTSDSSSTTADSLDGDESDGDSSEGTTGSEGDPGWHTLAPLPGGPRQETAVAARDGQVYVLGGFVGSGAIVADVARYDPATDTWASVADAPAAMHHAHLAAHGEALYLLGSLRGYGFDQDGASWAYDPATDGWTAVTEMPLVTARGGGGAATIGDRIYVVGGLAGGQAVADAWAYEPDTDTWTPLADLPTPRDHLGVAAVDGLVYAVGGRDGTIGGHTDRMDIYDPATDSWSDGPPMPTSRGGVAIGATNTQIYVAGGEGNAAARSGVFDQLETFRPSDGAWEALQVMPIPRHGTGGATVGATFYVPGGATVEALGAVDDHEAWGP